MILFIWNLCLKVLLKVLILISLIYIFQVKKVSTRILMAKISIIMGIYNCADTLCEAIDSILAQTYTNWQVIMCDDGSTDNTYDIAQKYVERYPDKFILLRNEKNLGLNQTLNNCLAVADGTYIARMDGDDISLPERLETEIEFLEAHPEYAIVSTPMKYFDKNGVFREGKGGGEPNIKRMPLATPFCHAPCMVRKEAYDAVGGYSVDKRLLRVEDWHLWIKMYSKGYRGYVLEKSLYSMRDDQSAIFRRKFKYRLNETYVGILAVKMLNLPFCYYILTLRPIIVGLLPKAIYSFLHKKNTK